MRPYILYALQVVLSIKLIFAMELFLNRSVKNLNLAAFRTEEFIISHEAARLRFLTDQVFTHLKRKIRF